MVFLVHAKEMVKKKPRQKKWCYHDYQQQQPQSKNASGQISWIQEESRTKSKKKSQIKWTHTYTHIVVSMILKAHDNGKSKKKKEFWDGITVEYSIGLEHYKTHKHTYIVVILERFTIHNSWWLSTYDWINNFCIEIHVCIYIVRIREWWNQKKKKTVCMVCARLGAKISQTHNVSICRKKNH